MRQLLTKIFFENRSLKQTVLKNSFWLFSTSILGRFFKFFLIIYAARVLGPEVFGEFSYWMSFMLFSFMFSDCGISTFLVREYQRVDSQRLDTLLGTLFRLKITVLLGTFFAVLIYLQLNSLESVLPFVYVLLIMSVSDSMKSYFFAVARARNHMQFTGVSDLIDMSLTSGLGLLVLYFSASPFLLSVAYLGGSLATLLAINVMIRFPFNALVFFNRSLCGTFARNMLPFVLINTSYIIMTQTDTIMLRWLTNFESVGQYAVAVKILHLCMLIPFLMTGSIFPIFSKYFDNHEKVLVMFRKVVSALLIISIPISIGGVLVAPLLVAVLYGITYLEAISAMQLLLLVLPFSFLSFVMAELMIALRIEWRAVRVLVIVAILNVALNAYLIPILGLNGAPIATLIARLTEFLVLLILMSRYLGAPIIRIRTLLVSLFASFIMAIWVYGILAKLPLLLAISADMTLLISILTGAFIYGILLWGFGEPLSDELVAFTKKGFQEHLSGKT